MEATTVEPSAQRSVGHWALLALAAALPLFLFGFARFLEPDPSGIGTHRQLGFPECAAMRLFDLPCPGCGVTTSVTLAARGRLSESLSTQPLGLVLAGCVLLALPLAVLAHLRGRDLAALVARLVRGWRAWAAAAFALGCWIYKIWLVRG